MKPFCVLTLSPEIFPGPLGIGVIGRALQNNLLSIEAVQIRQYAKDTHKTTDDIPYGGGGGMVMKPEPLAAAIEEARSKMPLGCPVLLMTPQGRPLSQALIRELSERPGWILVCGRYEGFDERIRQNFVDLEISAGDYVLSGGELPAMVVIDAIARLLPGVLGNPESLKEESFQRPLLEYPQYTRPVDFRGHKVPDILLSGHHEKIRLWRLKESIRRTIQRRPDLLDGMLWNREEEKLLRQIEDEAKKVPE